MTGQTGPTPIDRHSARARPAGMPLMRQNWGKLLFMHWRVEERLLRPLVPARLSIDTFDGHAWVGLVPFTMWGIRPAFAPPVPFVSAFHELNVRTYVHLDGVPGVWFHSLDAERGAAVWGARTFFHLPYYKADMRLRQTGARIVYDSVRRRGPRAEFHASWEVEGAERAAGPGTLDYFLTERYCLYAARGDGRLYRARVSHRPWPLQSARLLSLESSMLESHGLPTPEGEPVLHYAEKLSVDVWGLRRV
jgi:uncharacterized protein YqjF (DUF2071 family)